jgi:hypothetical protein
LPTLTLAGIALLYGLFTLLYSTPDATVLLLPGLMIITLLVAPWMDRLGFAALLMPMLLAVMVYPSQDLSREHQVRPLAETLLREAPPNALLLTPGDRTIFTLWYFHHVEGQRPDLRLVDANLFAFDWYRSRLSDLYPDVVIPVGDDLIALQHNNISGRPFCEVGLASPPESMPISSEHLRLSAGPPYLFCIEEVD